MSNGATDTVQLPNRWVIAVRPKTLWAAVCPVVMGSAIALGDGVFHLPSAIACLLGAVLLQIGANFVNDYADGIKGTDSGERLGPPRAVALGLIGPQAMKGAAILVFAAVWIPGLYIIYRGGPVFLAVGIVSILAGILYTSGPFPLAYHGLGEIFAFVFFGPVAVAGTHYVQTQEFSMIPLIAGVGPGLFSVAILTANNLRDIDGDRKAGKKTLPVRFGTRFAQAEYIGAILIAALGIPALLVWLTAGHFYTASAGLTALLAWPAMRTVMHYRDPRTLNRILAYTGVLLLMYTLLFSVGWNI